MSGALFLKPLPFTVVSANQQDGAPAKWLNVDEPGMVWRSNGTSGVYLTVQLTGSSLFDTLALTGYIGAAGDRIRVRVGGSADAVAGTTGLATDVTFTAWSGVTPASGGAIALHQFANTVSGAFVRIDITSAGAPAYVEASRLAIGKAVVCDGVDIGAEQNVEDASSVEDVLGSTSIDPYRVRFSWKVDMSGIDEAAYYANWWPFMLAVGNSHGFLFAPDTASAYLQNQALFGRATSSAKGSSVSGDTYSINMSIKSV